MKVRIGVVLRSLFLILAASSFLVAAEKAPKNLICVSLMSETDGSYLSARSGKADWVAVKVGDSIPVTAELRVSADRDWAEFVTDTDATKVYLIEGTSDTAVVTTAAALLKTPARTVKFPVVSANTDPAFKDKMVVRQVTGRQIYRANPDTKDKDIHYGDVLDIAGKVRIIGINNPLVLVFPNGASTTVIGPLNFEVKKVLAGSNLYKYLNVTK